MEKRFTGVRRYGAGIVKDNGSQVSTFREMMLHIKKGDGGNYAGLGSEKLM
jgi:hypothetical protein